MWKVTNLVRAFNGLRSRSPQADVPERDRFQRGAGGISDAPMAELLLNDLSTGANVIADKGTAPHTSRRDQTVTKKRKPIERFLNKLNQLRHIATRSPLNYLAMIKTACVRRWLCLMNLRLNECDSGWRTRC
jgi:hypothetical protein